jgi:PTH1 family peptidyl-tRNA hydrolase
MAIENVRMVIGLGNPDPAYEDTYHNSGILAVTALTPGAYWHTKAHFRYTKANGLIFIKPIVFMNESGLAAKEALRYFKVRPDHLLLIHDDSDLLLGTWKIQFGRGSAGHKGVASVIAALKTGDFFRARIGIRPANEKKRLKAGDFVLAKIGKMEKEKLAVVFDKIREELGVTSSSTPRE